MLEFHISRQSRDRYKFDESIFHFTGNAVIADFYSARVFAQKMNAKRDLVHYPEQAVSASQINALGLLDEILHAMIANFRKSNPGINAQILNFISGKVGEENLEKTLRQFMEEFPPLTVYRREIDIEEYLRGETDGVQHREYAFEELLVLWLTNANPATHPYRELFDDSRLEKESTYKSIFTSLYDFFDAQPKYGPENQNFIEVLLAPSRHAPYSLTEQLEFIRRKWPTYLEGIQLHTKYFSRVLTGLDFIEEEQKVVFPGGGPGPAPVLEYSKLDAEIEAFSPDTHWMPNLVLLAKNTYVWLDQLSKIYKRPIHTLDVIPDEVLDQLSGWGFTGLWLIGLWERSPASKSIKRRMGNPDAVSSAYSLYDSVIAADLGGEKAYDNLRARALARGIRLAADMVPNHTGVDSRWVVQHPDRFLSLDHSPYPNYSFTGPNLTSDPNTGIFLEDRYYDKTDAAVVFKHVDFRTGRERYIYHGNDGTNMPWNDTAQIDYLNAEAREAVIQTILAVARKFPVIRFDAAMTLAKRHIQRLWFPEPGSGGAIPSRSEYGISNEDFDKAMPIEFWREVVDRVASEVPGTLLLAEAFWMMEGYFVRTLGMHRVYNSAFMNMMRDEENAKYRQVMKNTLAFDPEILKRFVNFMNNPDEETASEQFGDGDKYFAVSTLMVTMPGLPMFGHGQIEGFHEKYGMEYRRAVWNEAPNEGLVAHHERIIFPLLRKRGIFAEVENFLMYDALTPDGAVIEDIFAYSNQSGEERSLVVIYNKYARTLANIKTPNRYPNTTNTYNSLGESLGLTPTEDHYVIYRDYISGFEYIRRSIDIYEHGITLNLREYGHHVFLDFQEVVDDASGKYRRLHDYLNGRGVHSVDAVLQEVLLQPVMAPFETLLRVPFLEETEGAESGSNTLLVGITELFEKAAAFTKRDSKIETLAAAVVEKINIALSLPSISKIYSSMRSSKYLDIEEKFETIFSEATANIVVRGWLFTQDLGKIYGEENYWLRSRSWIDEWLYAQLLDELFRENNVDQQDAWVSLIKTIVSAAADRFAENGTTKKMAKQSLEGWLGNGEIRTFLGVNRYQGVLWYDKTRLAMLCDWMLVAATVEALFENTASAESTVAEVSQGNNKESEKLRAVAETGEAESTDHLAAQNRIVKYYDIVSLIIEADEVAGYKLEALLEGI